ncbi:MAG: SDR family oxidoreductase [Pseudonocardia sp.]|nr:SDR family oxidoreductase [Pseudonocardia sp.]
MPRWCYKVPLGRFARPEEVVGAIEFLVGPQASYITGASIDINGGWVTC